MVDSEVKVKEMMTTEVFTLGGHHALTLADDLMSLERIRHLPVLEDGRVVGVVSQRDLFRAALAAALGYRQRARRTLQRTIRVNEVMSAPAHDIT
jgi:CBS domain-containing membrane protein